MHENMNLSMSTSIDELPGPTNEFNEMYSENYPLVGTEKPCKKLNNKKKIVEKLDDVSSESSDDSIQSSESDIKSNKKKKVKTTIVKNSLVENFNSYCNKNNILIFSLIFIATLPFIRNTLSKFIPLDNFIVKYIPSEIFVSLLITTILFIAYVFLS